MCKHTPAPGVVNYPVGVPELPEAAEDRERVPRHGLPDELAARLDLAVHALGERLGVLLRGRADDQVLPAALDRVALALERLGERTGLAVRREGDPDLPRRVAALELLFLPGLARRLVVPAVLGVEPVLDRARLRLDLLALGGRRR